MFSSYDAPSKSCFEYCLSNEKTFNLQVKSTQPKLYVLTLVPAVLISTLNKKTTAKLFKTVLTSSKSFI